ncbi:MAG: NAD(P)/FAD-dependent oxidoreductase, partial [Pseudomonadota bacterium]
FLPFGDYGYLLTGQTTEDTAATIARISPRDAAALPAYFDWLEDAADALRAQLFTTPPASLSTFRNWLRVGKLAHATTRLSARARQALFELFTQSAAQVLSRWFDHPHVKALFGFDAIVGNFRSPYDDGSAYVLLHHVFGETNGVSGAWGHAIGGMGAITQAMASSAKAAGAEIRTNARVARVLHEDGVAVGVALDNGEHLYAAKIAANVTPKRLLLDLCDRSALADDVAAAFKQTAYGSGTFRMNVALADLPRFTALPEPGPHLSSGIILAPTLDYMDRAYLDARMHGWSKQPVVEMLIPSTLDDSLAPAGQHVASLFCQHVQPRLSDGREWADHREEVAELMLATVDRFAPGFRQLVLGYQALSPWDLERTLGLTDGDIFHGRLSLGQLFSARPVAGFADYRMPFSELYLCGSGAHPGGGVTGIPGHNAAQAMLQDRWRNV